jgi:hypothetical protein
MILQAAHPGIESPTLDRGAAHLKDALMRRFAELDLQWLPFSLASKRRITILDRDPQRVKQRASGGTEPGSQRDQAR